MIIAGNGLGVLGNNGTTYIYNMDNGRGGTNGEINHNKTTKETYGEETDTEVSMKLMKMMTKK